MKYFQAAGAVLAILWGVTELLSVAVDVTHTPPSDVHHYEMKASQ